jgi:flagellin-specific chaperone FliS
VRAADKGLEISRRLDTLFQAQSEKLDDAQLSQEALSGTNEILRQLGQFWSTPQRYGSISSAA